MRIIIASAAHESIRVYAMQLMSSEALQDDDARMLMVSRVTQGRSWR